MNNGGGVDSSKDSSKETEPCVKRRRKNDEFAQAIARIAVAQVCESVGFQGFQQSALDTFSDVCCKYIREIGNVSSFYSNLAGRTECNVFDVIQGLEDLNLSQGFVGASDRDSCLSGSGIVNDLSLYVPHAEKIGFEFAYSIPSFPVVKERKLPPSFLQAGETPPTDDIPPWLPVFLDPKPDTEETQIMEVVTAGNEEEKKVLEPQPSSKLELFRARNESVFPMVVEQGVNPFLSAPLQHGEKVVSSVLLPAKLKEDDLVEHHSNNVFERDQAGPTDQVVKNGGCETEEGGEVVVLKKRPSVQMKFHTGKKLVSSVVRPDGKGKEKVAAWFINDEVAMETEGHTGNDSVVN